ncbi:MAG: carbon storage regulator [Methylococcales bacterium]
MLVLDRKSNESILIETPNGDTIEITLLETTKGRGKLGIDAPKEYIILRDELVEDYATHDH